MEHGAKYDWDKGNKDHIALHGIAPHEVEEVLANGPVYRESDIDRRSGEERVLELGHTNTLRVLFVVWTSRAGVIRPVTAWDANRRERAKYFEARKETL